jgi:ribosomal protein L21E
MAKKTGAAPKCKVVLGNNSITLILTDEVMEKFQRGSELTISNDGSITLSLLEKTFLGRSSFVAKTKGASASSRTPYGVPGKEVETTQPLVSASNSDVTDGALPQSKHSPTSVKKKGDSLNRKGKEKKSPPDHLAAVEGRLRKCKLWKEELSYNGNLAALSEPTRTAVNQQSYLWKEYAIDNQLPGYEGSADNRRKAVESNPNHLPSHANKLLKKREEVASSNAGEYVRRTSGSEISQEKSYAEVAAKGCKAASATVSGADKEEKEKKRSLQIAKELSSLSSSSGTRTLRKKEGLQKAYRSRSSSNSSRSSEKSYSSLSTSKSKRKGLGRSGRGRKSRHFSENHA